MSVDRDTAVDVSIQGDGPMKVVVETTTTTSLDVGDAFTADGELRLWDDSSGWSGFLREDGRYYEVNQRHDDEEPLEKRPVGASTVMKKVARHIRGSVAGQPGEFVRGCSPP